MLKNNLNKHPIIPFIMTGDDTIEKTLEMADFYISNGIMAMEIGVPFSDPTADGPVIQRASSRAIKNGSSIQDSLRVVSAIKEKHPHVSVYLMSYLNPILTIDNKHIIDSNVDGLIIPDMPIEEFSILNMDIPIIGLIPINTCEERIKKICDKSGSFIYLVSNIGTTGASDFDYAYIYQTLERIRRNSDLPVAIGFGINSKEKVNYFKNDFDGIIIGSHFVELAYENDMTSIYEIIKKTAI
ncbi:tryptophan synthase subunit alpha [Acidaminobacter sp. JC074]|uniref:tryptophan synthase subunit alpha n=1 Tax=Acidaminobacter sp. JC074 TaxID=2530199 RepID=UPI001F0D2A2E|nr:tryptophan synthase subunit alpha [Acidaminobacter sp. JC074]MCH4889976.1 tryptophan synthase subunit alpha [Acidaminobacter sp. JC074]